MERAGYNVWTLPSLFTRLSSEGPSAHRTLAIILQKKAIFCERRHNPPLHSRSFTVRTGSLVEFGVFMGCDLICTRAITGGVGYHQQLAGVIKAHPGCFLPVSLLWFPANKSQVGLLLARIRKTMGERGGGGEKEV